MDKPSPWQLLERSLRRLLRFRELDAPADVVDAELQLVKRFWTHVPPLYEGARRVWPQELEALAKELGLEPDPRPRLPVPPDIAAGVAQASAQYAAAARVHQAIEEKAGVEDLNVSGSSEGLVLTGRVKDAAAKELAGEIAAELTGAKVTNELVVAAARKKKAKSRQ